MGVVGSDEQVRILLRSGAAGRGVPTTGGVLYDEQSVRELVSRPTVDRDELATTCPHGLYVARLPRDLCVDVTGSWERTAARLSRVPAMPAMTAALLQVRLRMSGRRLPWVATVSGFVVLGADLTGIIEASGVDGPEQRFRLEPPGKWFAGLERRWFPTGRGGRPWHIWEAGPSVPG
jgi:hypothetical protein